MTSANAIFGRYELRGVLGQGGFAVAYRAWDTRLQREVALKILRAELAVNVAFAEGFLREAQRNAQLRHPHIVTVYDTGEVDGTPFIAMELINGRTLAASVPAGQGLPLARVTSILTDLCSAVDYLHHRGFVHRDIKAANVMVEDDGRIVLMDFGIARSLDATVYTSTGTITGSPEAMAPEQVRGEPTSPATDIYALGILTYRLLAGRAPFSGEASQVMYAQTTQPPPPLRQLRPNLPDHVYAAVDAALAKAPQARPATARAFADLLANAPTVPATPSGSAPRRRPSPLVFGAAAGVVTLGIVGAIVAIASSGGHAARLRTIAATQPVAQAATAPPTVQTAVPGLASAPATATSAPTGTATASPAAVSPATAAATAPSTPAATASPTAATATPTASPQPSVTASGTAAPVTPTSTVTVPSGWTATTIVGGSDAQSPYGLAVDGQGNVYVADGIRIKKVAPNGTVTTLAGGRGSGFADGPGDQARFLLNLSLALDAAGNVYVGDTLNNRVRKVTPDGTVTTLAGGNSGYADGSGAQARFSHPEGVAIDSAGNVYVADRANARIRRIAPDGTTTTIAESTKFGGPGGVAEDDNGTLYIADTIGDQVFKLTKDGHITVLAKDPQFSLLGGIAVDKTGVVYVYDSYTVYAITPDGTVSTVKEAAQISQPSGLAVDGSGNLYISSLGQSRVVKLAPQR